MSLDISSVAPGRIVSGLLETPGYCDGIRVAVPVVVVRGAGDGPWLAALAGQHGRELNGIEALRRVIGTLDPARLKGRAVFVPCAHPAAVRIRQQDFPHERGRYLPAAPSFNLNRAWPGRPDGTLVQRIAHALWEAALRPASVCIDLHGWTGSSASLVWGTRREADLVRAFGLELFRVLPAPDEQEGMLLHACRKAGQRGLCAELAPQKRLCEASVAAGARGVLNVMKTLGMIEGDPELPDEQVELDDGEAVLTAECSGLLVPRLRPPARVRAGEVVAEIVDWNDVLNVRPVVSPMDGVVFNMGGLPWGEETGETSVKDAGETVALVKSYRRILRNR